MQCVTRLQRFAKYIFILTVPSGPADVCSLAFGFLKTHTTYVCGNDEQFGLLMARLRIDRMLQT